LRKGGRCNQDRARDGFEHSGLQQTAQADTLPKFQSTG
jgi:hypothetical protein